MFYCFVFFFSSRSRVGQTQRVCAPSIVLLGFHKCGTSDLTHAAKHMFSTATLDLFLPQVLGKETCPSDGIEMHEKTNRYASLANQK